MTPQNGPFWLAAGLDVVALEILTISAVVVISFNPAVVLAIFANAVTTMPTNAKPDEAFLYAELGVSSVIDFAHGTMITQGQLAPNSFVLDPSCHLTDGFC